MYVFNLNNLLFILSDSDLPSLPVGVFCTYIIYYIQSAPAFLKIKFYF